MPTTWLFEPILHAFILTSVGSAPLDEFFCALDQVLAHPRARDRMRILIDNSRLPAPRSEIIREGITRLVRYADRLKEARVVLVVPGESDHGIGRLATMMLEDRVDIEVFNDMAAAVISLTMDAMD
ncbi:MAG TPA: hypothetical protein VL295_00165 [Gemmatimonadales bacterium]|nr:hypothetical protein [Gemmatimonadales bacterium]